MLITTEREKRIPLYKQIDLAHEAAERDMQELAQAMQSPQDALLLNALQEKRMQYRKLFLNAVDELESVGAEGTLEQFWAPTRDAFKALETSSGQLADNVRDKLKRLHQAKLLHANATNNLYLWLAGLIAFSTCLGAIVAAYLWSKPCIRPS